RPIQGPRPARAFFVFGSTGGYSMRLIAGVALGVVMLVTAGSPADDKAEKIDRKKLIGKWEPPDTPKGVSLVIEFTKDGKLVVSADVGGKTEKMEANYK